MGNQGWKYLLAYLMGMVPVVGVFYLIFYWWLGLPLIDVSEAFLVLTLLLTTFYWSLYYVQKMSGLKRRWRWSMFLLWCLGVVGCEILFWWSGSWTWETLATNLLILVITAMLCGGVTWLLYRNAVKARLGVRPDDPDSLNPQ